MVSSLCPPLGADVVSDLTGNVVTIGTVRTQLDGHNKVDFYQTAVHLPIMESVIQDFTRLKFKTDITFEYLYGIAKN